MIKVSKIEWIAGYRLKVRFNDESIGGYDFAGLVAESGPMVEPLRDIDYFKRVFLEFGAPTWPNGFDIAPAWLHQEIAAAGNLIRPTHA
jgi:hypothetical protein